MLLALPYSPLCHVYPIATGLLYPLKMIFPLSKNTPSWFCFQYYTMFTNREVMQVVNTCVRLNAKVWVKQPLSAIEGVGKVPNLHDVISVWSLRAVISSEGRGTHFNIFNFSKFTWKLERDSLVHSEKKIKNSFTFYLSI